MTYGVMVRMDFSPRVICCTPSSQPIQVYQQSNLLYTRLTQPIQVFASLSRGGEILEGKVTLDDLSNANLNIQRSTTRRPRAIKPIKQISVSIHLKIPAQLPPIISFNSLLALESLVGLLGIIKPASVVDRDLIARSG